MRRVTLAWFLAALRNMLGPPISMSSPMASWSETSGLAMVFSNGYRLSTTRSMGWMPCFAAWVSWSGFPRRNSNPPCTFGCRVLNASPFEHLGEALPPADFYDGNPRILQGTRGTAREGLSLFLVRVLEVKSTSPVLS